MFLKNQTLSLIRRVRLNLVRKPGVARHKGVLVDHLDISLSDPRDHHFVVVPDANHCVSRHEADDARACPPTIWTVRYYEPAAQAAYKAEDFLALRVLFGHHPYADHCGGYDVHAWPCAPAAEVLDRILGGAR